MTCPNKFPKYYSRYRVFQIYDLRLTKNKLYFLIPKTRTMPIRRTQPLEHIIFKNPITIIDEENFIIRLIIELL